MTNAKDFYALGLKAYNGDESSRKTFFEIFSKIVIPIAKRYCVLPSFAMAKAVIESGWFTNEWNKTLKNLTGCQALAKAQDYNNIYSMNAWDENKRYLPNLPTPEWVSYGTTFMDYGPHWQNGKIIAKYEPWKSYPSIEHAVQDWCGNMRYQAEAHGHVWEPFIMFDQLLATESFTPEGGTKGVRKSLHYEWEEQIMQLYEKYGLSKYDKDLHMPKVTLTRDNLDTYMRLAYEFTHKHCIYGPSGTYYPPGATGVNDCVGEGFVAFWLMGRYPNALNIDQIQDLCEENGMIRTNDPEYVWKHHCIVCMQDKNNAGTRHVNHVFYSLGGTSIYDISKYDLGSDTRIESPQPFTHVPVNEWIDRRNFLCAYYVDDGTTYPSFTGKELFKGTTKRSVNLRAGAGKQNAILGRVPKDVELPVYAAVTTSGPNVWFYTEYEDKKGWVYKNNLRFKSYPLTYKKYVVRDVPDNQLACRMGAGIDYPLFRNKPHLHNGDAVRAFAKLKAKDGTEWHNVLDGKYFYFVSAMWLREAKKQ